MFNKHTNQNIINFLHLYIAYSVSDDFAPNRTSIGWKLAKIFPKQHFRCLHGLRLFRLNFGAQTKRMSVRRSLLQGKGSSDDCRSTPDSFYATPWQIWCIYYSRSPLLHLLAMSPISGIPTNLDHSLEFNRPCRAVQCVRTVEVPTTANIASRSTQRGAHAELRKPDTAIV